MQEYDHTAIEKKWQEEWDKSGIYRADDKSKKPKFYALIEFPYPSGDGLHVGHVRSNTAMDIISRKRRMEGANVLYPIGWDAFGLPAENYALKTGIHPSVSTKQNAETFRKQLKALGFSFDWSREIDTTDPAYYKWTQWIFLKFLENGLAYKKRMAINWCPKDKIGLANEEVIDGKCERCGTPVEKREKEQWMLAITKYADRLDSDLDTVDYLEKIKTQQRNWIGRSEGAEVDFKIKGGDTSIKVFTTRIDTLYGVTYLVLSPEHVLVEALGSSITNLKEVSAYRNEAKMKPEIERTAEGKDKTGVELKGVRAINPANSEEVPVFVADYVLSGYGTGAIMAVPAHDERDFAFAKKFGLPIRTVIEPLFILRGGPDGVKKELPLVERDAALAIIKHWSEDKFLCLKWKKVAWNGFVIGGIEKGETAGDAAVRETIEETGYLNPTFVKDVGTIHSQFFHIVKNQNRFGHFKIVYLELKNGDRKDISAEENEIHEIHWVARKDVENFIDHEDMKCTWALFNGEASYSDEGLLTNSAEFDRKTSEEAKSAIAKKVGAKMVTTYKLRDWVFSRQRYWGEPIPVIHCAKCGIVPVPEKDLPVELPKVENYQPTDTGESPLATIDSWVNVKCPKCGGPAKRETDTMPNWAGSSWYYLRYTDPKNDKAFAAADKLKYWTPVDWYNGGMEHTTLHLLYSRFWHKFLYDIKLVPTSEPYQKRTSNGLILAEGGEKMSKSKGNVVNPDGVIKTFGADSLRLYEMFIGPFDQHVVWSTDSIVGVRRFIERVWKLQIKLIKNSEKTQLDAKTEALMHKTIKKVTEDIEAMRFNTAVSTLMIYLNDLEKLDAVPVVAYENLLLLIAPFAPHVAEELWADVLENKNSIHLAPWPQFDPAKATDASKIIAVQINGRTRATFELDSATASSMSDKDLETKALALPEVKKWTDGKTIKKVIVVKGKLVSIVLAD